MSTAPEVRFDSVLSRRSAEKRTVLFVVPAVVVIVAIVGFAAVAISRMSGLETQLRGAREQSVEANRIVEQRDRELREAKADVAVLGSVGQGAAVLAATSKDGTASGVVLDHPAQHALAVYAFNLVAPPDGQEYRLVVTDGNGQESLLGALRLDQRGGAFLMARDVPEGIAKVEVALVPAQAAGSDAAKGAGPAAKGEPNGGSKADAKAEAMEASAPPAAPVERRPVLAGALPRPGEAGVVLATQAGEGGQTSPQRAARSARRGR